MECFPVSKDCLNRTSLYVIITAIEIRKWVWPVEPEPFCSLAGGKGLEPLFTESEFKKAELYE